MIRQEFTGTHTEAGVENGTNELGAMRWNGMETRIDIVGKLTLDTIDELINVLKTARRAREDFERSSRPRKRGRGDR